MRLRRTAAPVLVRRRRASPRHVPRPSSPWTRAAAPSSPACRIPTGVAARPRARAAGLRLSPATWRSRSRAASRARRCQGNPDVTPDRSLPCGPPHHSTPDVFANEVRHGSQGDQIAYPPHAQAAKNFHAPRCRFSTAQIFKDSVHTTIAPQSGTPMIRGRAKDSVKGTGMTEQQERMARERAEIAARVANFKATQEKFERERDEYFVTTLRDACRVERL